MNEIVMLTLSLIAALCGNITKKYYTGKSPQGLSAGFIFNAVSCMTAAVIFLCWGGFGAASAYTVILGAVFGAVTALQGITNIAALQVGPMSYTSVIISFSTLLSALSGVAFFGESLGWAQGVGIVLMLASFVLAAKSDAEKKKANAKWMLLCLVAFAATGAIGIMQKVHQSSGYKEELNAFLITAFVISAVFSAVLAAVLKRRQGQATGDNAPVEARKTGLFLLLLGIILANGITVAVNNKFNLILSGKMDSAVFFPIVNGGGLVLTTLAAVILFRERLTKKQWAGVALGILSVVFLCNPFA